MQQQLILTKDEIAIWTWLVSRGIANSLSGLSQMAGQDLIVTGLDLKHFPPDQKQDIRFWSPHHPGLR